MKKILAFALVLSITAGLFAIPNLLSKNEFDAAAIKNLDFELAWEDLEIKETFDSSLSIEVYCNYRKFAPEIRASGSSLQIESKQYKNTYFPFSKGTNCTVVMYVPHDKSFNDVYIKASCGDITSEKEVKANLIKIVTSSGDIEVNGGLFADEIRVKATSGDVKLNNLDADTLSVETSSGDINISAYTGGTGLVKATSGDIKLEDFAVEYGNFKASSGTISLRRFDSDYFDVETTSGNQYLFLKTAPIAKSKISASSGNIDLVIPKDGDFEVDVHSSSGTFKSTFSNNRLVPRNTFHEKINGGGPVIEISTSSGSISLDY